MVGSGVPFHGAAAYKISRLLPGVKRGEKRKQCVLVKIAAGTGNKKAGLLKKAHLY
jgi:hypothetical protein